MNVRCCRTAALPDPMGVCKVAAAATLVVLSGCAQIGQRPPVNQDQVFRAESIETPVTGAHANVTQSGTEVSLVLSEVCDVGEKRFVHRTSEAEHYNMTPTTDWLLAGGSAVSVATSGILLVDATSTYPNDATSRTYNSTGPAKERGYAYSLLGVGAVLGVAALVDVIKANGSDVERTNVTLTGEPNQRGVRCTNRPVANTVVRGGFHDKEFTLGTTDSRGRMSVDLNQVVPEDLVLPASASSIEIRADGHVAGNIGVIRLVGLREAAAFKRAQPDQCAEPKQADSCAALVAFLKRYPDGPHGREAQAVIQRAQPKLAEVVDDTMWSLANGDNCTKTKFETSDEVMAACQPLRAYLETFPEAVIDVLRVEPDTRSRCEM